MTQASDAATPNEAGVFETEAVIDNGSFGKRTIRFETGRLAKQAAGSVVAYLDDTFEIPSIPLFKTEQQAYSAGVWFVPTLQSFHEVFARGDYVAFALNSIYLSLGSTLLCFVIAIPAA